MVTYSQLVGVLSLLYILCNATFVLGFDNDDDDGFDFYDCSDRCSRKCCGTFQYTRNACRDSCKGVRCFKKSQCSDLCCVSSSCGECEQGSVIFGVIGVIVVVIGVVICVAVAIGCRRSRRSRGWVSNSHPQRVYHTRGVTPRGSDPYGYPGSEAFTVYSHPFSRGGQLGPESSAPMPFYPDAMQMYPKPSRSSHSERPPSYQTVVDDDIPPPSYRTSR